MKNIAVVMCVGGSLFLSACAQNIPDQETLDICSKQTGLSKKLTVVTDASGSQSLAVSPEGSKLSVEEAVALKNCTDNL